MFHYKDKSPEETIQNIEKFFNNQGIIIKKLFQSKSEIETYSCSYGLYWHNKQILKCNGKGISKLYSKASCFGELYERFCAFSFSGTNNIFLKNDIVKLRKEKYGYSFYPSEKKITKEEYFNNTYLKNSYFFNNILNKTDNSFFEFFSNMDIVGCPYKSLIDNSIKYQDFSTIMWNTRTTGLAAGNSIEEALVQGCSELFERIVVEKFFKEIQESYYLINNKILNKDYQYKINILKNLGYDVYIYDLSYNFYLPVLFLMIYNPEQQVCFFKFGSHPIFDVALERCFTELYQGYSQLPIYDNNITLSCYNPCKINQYIKNNNRGIFSCTSELVFPYFIFNNNIVISYNTDYFLNINTQYTNKELLNIIKKIIIKNNYHFHWLNISLSSQIFTVHIIPQENLLSYNFNDYIETIQFTEEDKNNFTIGLKLIYNFFSNLKYKSELIYNQDIIIDRTNQILNILQKIQPYDIVSIFPYLNIILTNNVFKPFELKSIDNILDGYNNLLYLIIQEYDKIYFPIRDSRKLIWEEYQNLSLLPKNFYKYINNNISFIPNDFETFNIYLIYILYIYNFWQIYHSDEYQEFIQLLVENFKII